MTKHQCQQRIHLGLPYPSINEVCYQRRYANEHHWLLEILVHVSPPCTQEMLGHLLHPILHCDIGTIISAGKVENVNNYLVPSGEVCDNIVPRNHGIQLMTDQNDGEQWARLLTAMRTCYPLIWLWLVLLLNPMLLRLNVLILLLKNLVHVGCCFRYLDGVIRCGNLLKASTKFDVPALDVVKSSATRQTIQQSNVARCLASSAMALCNFAQCAPE